MVGVANAAPVLVTLLSPMELLVLTSSVAASLLSVVVSRHEMPGWVGVQANEDPVSIAPATTVAGRAKVSADGEIRLPHLWQRGTPR
jgi:hypothetical protein